MDRVHSHNMNFEPHVHNADSPCSKREHAAKHELERAADDMAGPENARSRYRANQKIEMIDEKLKHVRCGLRYCLMTGCF